MHLIADCLSFLFYWFFSLGKIKSFLLYETMNKPANKNISTRDALSIFIHLNSWKKKILVFLKCQAFGSTWLQRVPSYWVTRNRNAWLHYWKRNSSAKLRWKLPKKSDGCLSAICMYLVIVVCICRMFELTDLTWNIWAVQLVVGNRYLNV